MSLARGVLTVLADCIYIYIYSKLSDFIWYQIIINYIYIYKDTYNNSEEKHSNRCFGEIQRHLSGFPQGQIN